MKKFFIVLTLSAVLVYGAFAQVNFGGSLYTGVQLDIPSEGDESFHMNHRDEGNTRLDLTGSVNKGKFGAKLDTTFTYNPAAPENFFRLNGIYGWVNFLKENQLRLSIGKISDAVWVTSLDGEYQFDEVNGARLEYKTPLKGLSVGVVFDVGSNPAINYTAENLMKQTIWGASYVNPNFNTVVAYDLGSNARTLFGFNFTGIDELSTAGIELLASDMALWDESGSIRIDEEVAYRITRPFTAALHLGQVFYGNTDEDVELTFIPGVRYRILPQLTAFLDLEINTKDSFETTNMVITPWLEYSLGGSGLLYLQYSLELPDFKDPVHTIGFGLDIKAF
jgi:hypothetical protein